MDSHLPYHPKYIPNVYSLRDPSFLFTGVEQCEKNKELLEGFAIKANLTSPARRASDTAARMTISNSSQQEEKGGDVFLRMVESLHPAGMSTTCEDLFDTMGYGPLRKFHEAPDGNTP